MYRFKKAYKLLRDNPRVIVAYILLCIFDLPFLTKHISNKTYLKVKFYYFFHRKLDLSNPKTMNEKLQWLKINDRNPLYTDLVDKYKVREYIKRIIGEEYLIPLIGMWDKFEEIDFSKLPNQFVLKCTHDSGGVVICMDKNKFDIEAARRKINKSLKRNYYYTCREWPYKNVKPRIICEELIETRGDSSLIDYKFHCFDGETDDVMVCVGRSSGNPKFFLFDNEWNLMRYDIYGINALDDFTLPKPKKLDELFRIARELSRGLNFVRVDLYYEEEKIYFGELTFFPQGGFDSTLLEATDILFGEKIKLKSWEDINIL